MDLVINHIDTEAPLLNFAIFQLQDARIDLNAHTVELGSVSTQDGAIWVSRQGRRPDQFGGRPGRGNARRDYRPGSGFRYRPPGIDTTCVRIGLDIVPGRPVHHQLPRRIQ
jgi:hypothetical protein